jgi:hypothetical protein
MFRSEANGTLSIATSRGGFFIFAGIVKEPPAFPTASTWKRTDTVGLFAAPPETIAMTARRQAERSRREGAAGMEVAVFGMQKRFATPWKPRVMRSADMLSRLVPLLALTCFIGACSSNSDKPATEEEPGLVGRIWDSTVNAGQKLNPFDSKMKPREMKQTAPVNYKALATEVRVEPPAPKLGEHRQVAVVIRLTNKSKRLVQLNFPTTQRIDVTVKNKAGKFIEIWSDDQKFENEAGLVAINPGERLEYTANISTREMVAGEEFIVDGFLPNHEPLRASATVIPVR